MKTWLAILSVVTLAGTGALGAAPGDERFLDSRDGLFLTQMASVNTMAIALGHAAAERAASPSVKALASRILTDRSRLAAKLGAAGTEHSVGVGQMTPYQRMTVDWVGRTAGTAFDREYLEAALLALGNNVDRFDDEARTGTDPGLRDVAATELSSLRADRMLAKALVARIESLPESGGL